MIKNIFTNIYDYEDDDIPFQLFIGGRGTGKTYSALSAVQDKKIILMRRTADELELLLDQRGDESGNPFQTLNRDYGWNYGLNAINTKVAGIYHREMDEEGVKLVPVGAPVGLAVALSTVSKVRGMDFSRYTDLVYDEFIPEKHVKRMRKEGDAFLNAYETINRNREFFGQPPLRAWLLANANDIYNPICVSLGVVSELEKMQRRGQEHLYLYDRGLGLHLLRNSREFEEKKSKTAIAKLTKGTSFYDMAYKNEFSYNDFTNVGQKKLAGYVPVCAVDKAYIYRKKGAHEIYVSYAPTKIGHYKADNTADKIRFKREVGIWLQPYYVQGDMYFESYELKEIVLSMLFS